MQGNSATQRKIAGAAVPAHSGDLDRALIDVHVVDLICLGGRVRTGNGNVDRSIDRDADVDQATGKMTAAAIAGAV